MNATALPGSVDIPSQFRRRGAESREKFGVYVHWPYCAAKCPYCDFNSHVRAAIDESGWTAAIFRELSWTADLQGASRPKVDSIFFGGGTPSLASGGSIGAIIEAIARHWQLDDAAEITLESNPASVDAGRFRDYRAAGVNRISLGIQALNDADLKFLGRLHTAEEARAALNVATSTFGRVSLDLIYARPNQDEAQWRSELRDALAYETEHLSLYQLTIEEGTPFAALARSGALRIPGDEMAVSLYEITQELTEQVGRPAYEISNHARPGAECRHNLLYWRYGDYAGVGPGAHGRLTAKGKRLATVCEKLPERWRDKVQRDGNGIANTAEIPPADAAREHLLMNLRLAEGIDISTWQSRWHAELDASRVAALIEAGFLRTNGARIAATPRGRLLLNTLVAELAP